MILLGGAAWAQMAQLECSSIRDVDTLFHSDQVVQQLSERFPEHAEHLALYSQDALEAAGFDLDAPVRAALVEHAQTDLHLGLRPDHALDGWIERYWETRLGQTSMRHRAEGDSVTLTVETDADTSEIVDGFVPRMVGHADDDPGCHFAVGTVLRSWPMMDEASPTESGLLLQMYRHRPDEFRVVVVASELPEQSEGLVPLEAGRRSLYGTWTPQLTARLNVEMEPMLELAVSVMERMGRPAPPELVALQESGVELAPGLEFVASVEEGADFLVGIPLQKPRRARGVLRKLSHLENATRDGRLVRIEREGQEIFIGGRRDVLVVGSTPERVLQSLQREGELLVANDWAEDPGVFIGMEAEASQQLASRVPWFSEEGEFAVHFTSGDSVLDLRFLMPQLRASIPEALTEGVATRLIPEPVPDKAFGGPPPEHPNQVLLEIRKAQLQREVFVGYAGGPRSELDASSVPWSGIPELGVAPRGTPCRYEVDAGPDSWSAVALCDQDEDGVPAMYVTSNTQPPYALTSPEVR